jgi:hypothetical protein
VAATTRGRRAPKIAEDELESIDMDMGEDPDDDEMAEDEEIPVVTPRATRSKAGARGKASAPASPTKPKKPASKATPKSKTTAAKAKAKASARKDKQQALFLSDPSDDDDAGAVVIDVSDGEYVQGAGTSTLGDSAAVSELVGDEREAAAMTSTLRSTAGTQVRRAAARAAKKRPAAVLVDPDGDSDDDAVFKGFGGRKRGRIG